MHAKNDEFKPLGVAILTVSDTRDDSTDKSGAYLVEAVKAAGHRAAAKTIVRDNINDIQTVVSAWISKNDIDAIIVTGGTGFTKRDVTPEAIKSLFDKEIEGFGELFRALSFEEIGTSTLLSRALGGFANRTLIFALPGSTSACRTGWQRIISAQLDSRTHPCNFAQLLASYKS